MYASTCDLCHTRTHFSTTTMCIMHLINSAYICTLDPCSPLFMSSLFYSYDICCVHPNTTLWTTYILITNIKFILMISNAHNHYLVTHCNISSTTLIHTLCLTQHCSLLEESTILIVQI